MREFRFASSIDEALVLVADGFVPVAGGTDLVVAARHGKAALPDKVVSLQRLGDLAVIESTHAGLLIGAAVTHTRLMASPDVVSSATALSDASALVGSPSTRNVGTIGGNIMNASPAMDTGAPLVVLDSEILLASSRGGRRVSPTDLWTGPGNTSAAPDEICTGVSIPVPPPGSGSAYVRLEYRRAMEIAVVGAAARVCLDPDGSGRVVSARVALTAVAPTIMEVSGVSEILTGVSLVAAGATSPTMDETPLAALADAASEQATPITDLRASDRYRRHCVGVMARRAVVAAATRAGGQTLAVPVNRSTGVGVPL